MNCELYVKFYKSASGKQNMWIEECKECGKEGMRYEVNDMEDVKITFEKYLKNIVSIKNIM